MSKNRGESTKDHIVNLIKKDDRCELGFYYNLIVGDHKIISDLKSSLDHDPEARKLIQENVPDFLWIMS